MKVPLKSPWFWAVIAIAGLRLYYCFSVPLYTTDIFRNLGYGLEFQHYGFLVYAMTPYDFAAEPYQYFWPNHEYPYPAVTLLFYAAVAKVWACIFFAKLVFTLIDFINAWLVYKVTDDRICALLYFFYPICLWYVSREGEFEPLVNFFMLLALWMQRRRHSSALFFLSLAVQTKLFPIFLLPWMLAQILRLPKRKILACAVWGAAGWLPSAMAALNSHYLEHLFSPGYVPISNTISWAILHPDLLGFTPFWLALAHFIAGVIFAGASFYCIRQENRFLPYLAPLVFVTFVKSNPIGQFWYMILTPVFCLTVENPRHRRLLMALSWLFSLRSSLSILIGPFAYQNPRPVYEILQKAMFGI
ncbi:MAG: hypothetical protein AB1656_07885 [Candidatus Omnitrophota bacterium]